MVRLEIGLVYKKATQERSKKSRVFFNPEGGLQDFCADHSTSRLEIQKVYFFSELQTEARAEADPFMRWQWA